MEIILLEKIRNLGGLGDKVKVKPGYGRNFLIPNGKAIPATNENLKVFEQRRAELEKVAKEGLVAAEKRAETINAFGTLTIAARAAEEGKLYGSVSNIEIVEALNKAGVKIHKSEISLPQGPIRHIGEYDIDILLHTDVTATLKVVVVAE